jgi:hypothetical protein
MTSLVNITSTTSPVLSGNFFGGDYHGSDILVRLFQEKQSGAMQVLSTSTQMVRDGFENFYSQYVSDIGLLRSVIFWQKRTIDYQALHTAFLLNAMSEEDFELESQKFVAHQKAIDAHEIATTVERLDHLVGMHLDTSDYADYFQCTQENVLDGLRHLPHSKFLALLP